ncbi:MAG: GNAT family N-acetyltransferase [Rickettsiales bacterium]|nr:GNAT family N-acetyltransferase [Rickettsiales bacterium]
MYNKLKNIIPHKVKIDNFNARLLDVNQDLDLVQKFLEHNEDFFKLTTGKGVDKNEGKLFFDNLPQNKKIEDKFIIGIFDNNVLIALIDLVQGFLEESQWVMGSFIIDKDFRHKNIGMRLLQILEELLVTFKVNILRIVVQEYNPNAVKFWVKNGFVEIQRLPHPVFSEKSNVIMIKKLKKKEPTIYDKFFKNGKLVALPSKPDEQQELYKIMQSWFEKGKKYAEPEINNIIKSKIEYSDHATLRRNLVDTNFLSRSADGKEYCIN